MTSLNLNGKLWATGDNIGKQLIQKLGWTEGEGLGKNKQGSVHHVKVSLKNDRDGIGMKSDKFSNNSGLLRTMDYDMLLKSKYAEVNATKTEKPIERSMSRPKFGRAVKQDYFKPINNEDWTKITGNAETISSNKDKIIEIKESECKKALANDNVELDSKFITKKLNVNEYFEIQMKLKMERLQRCQNILESTNDEATIKSSNDEASIKSSNDEESVKSANNEVFVKKNELITSNSGSYESKKIKSNKEHSKKRKSKSDPESEIESPIKKRSKFSNDIIQSKKKKKRSDTKLTTESHIPTEINVKKRSKKDRANVSVSLNEDLEKSEVKLLHVANLLANEPIDNIIKNPKLDVKIKEELIKVEHLVNQDNLKVVEMKPLILSSPLDTSNIRDIKGYKYY